MWCNANSNGVSLIVGFQVVGAKTQRYLLEKSRVCTQLPKENSFHMLHYLVYATFWLVFHHSGCSAMLLRLLVYTEPDLFLNARIITFSRPCFLFRHGCDAKTRENLGSLKKPADYRYFNGADRYS